MLIRQLPWIAFATVLPASAPLAMADAARAEAHHPDGGISCSDGTCAITASRTVEWGAEEDGKAQAAQSFPPQDGEVSSAEDVVERFSGVLEQGTVYRTEQCV